MFSGVRLIDERTFSVTVKAQYEPYFYELSYLSVYPYPIGVIAPGCEVRDDGEGAYIANIDENGSRAGLYGGAAAKHGAGRGKRVSVPPVSDLWAV